jgi:hypothetical protein
MPRPTRALVTALRQSADRLRQGGSYEWGHVGRCNCGHLVQSVCELTDREIFQSFGRELDEWSEHAHDYCQLTGLPVDGIFASLHEVGFSRDDVRLLEWLEDPAVLSRLPDGRRHLRRNDREDVVLYMDTMAGMLEEQLV